MKKLNFGCGKVIKPKKEGWINVDIQKAKEIDKSFDFDKFPYPFKDNEFDYVLADNVLEHLENPKKVVNELWRISKPNAIIEVIVPYYKSNGAYNDFGHKTYWNKRGIEVLIDYECYSYKEIKFKIIENKLVSVNLSKYIPYFLKYYLDFIILNMYQTVNAKLKVIK